MATTMEKPRANSTEYHDVMITGGSGLLGQELIKQCPMIYAPPKSILNILNINDFKHINMKPSVVIHCAAVKTIECDRDRINAMKINIIGTANVVEFCRQHNSRLIYISTDYVFKGDKGNYAIDDEVLPQNYYAETKLAGEYVVKALNDHLIVRLSFAPNEYPYTTGFIDQFTTRLPVTKAVEKIKELIYNTTIGVYHICGSQQSVYEYALSTANGKNIQPIKLSDHDFKRPKDTSLINEIRRN